MAKKRKQRSEEEIAANKLTPEQIADTPADRVRSFGSAYYNPRYQRRRRYKTNSRGPGSKPHKFSGKSVAAHAQNLRGRRSPFWTESRLKRYNELGAEKYWATRWANLNQGVN